MKNPALVFGCGIGIGTIGGAVAAAFVVGGLQSNTGYSVVDVSGREIGTISREHVTSSETGFPVRDTTTVEINGVSWQFNYSYKEDSWSLEILPKNVAEPYAVAVEKSVAKPGQWYVYDDDMNGLPDHLIFRDVPLAIESLVNKK